MKSKGLEGWKEASMTEARWPLRTAIVEIIIRRSRSRSPSPWWYPASFLAVAAATTAAEVAAASISSVDEILNEIFLY